MRRAALLLITSNRGLCGAFNANLIREARRRLEELEAQDAHTELHLVGKKLLRPDKRRAWSCEPRTKVL